MYFRGFGATIEPMSRPLKIPEAGKMIGWTIKVTQRTKDRLRENAQNAGMSIGEYLDHRTFPKSTTKPEAPTGVCQHRQAKQITGNSGAILYKCTKCGENCPKPGSRIEDQP